jgi:hypothetical protein
MILRTIFKDSAIHDIEIGTSWMTVRPYSRARFEELEQKHFGSNENPLAKDVVCFVIGSGGVEPVYKDLLASILNSDGTVFEKLS